MFEVVTAVMAWVAAVLELWMAARAWAEAAVVVVAAVPEGWDAAEMLVMEVEAAVVWVAVEAEMLEVEGGAVVGWMAVEMLAMEVEAAVVWVVVVAVWVVDMAVGLVVVMVAGVSKAGAG